MRQSVDEANHEIRRIRALPFSVARSVAAEQAARRIEAEGPQETLAYALFTQLESYSWGGEPAKAYVPFGKLTRLWDEHPELFDEFDRHSFFWSFKWMVGNLKDHPEITAERIDATLNEMRRRYALAGNGLSGVAREAFSWAKHRGADDVDLHYQLWIAVPRDDFSQCEVCSLSEQAEHHADSGRPEEALRIVAAAIATGETCGTEPAEMLAFAALLQLDLGRPAEAVATHRKAVAALEKCEGAMAAARGRRFELLARGGQPERAFRALSADAAFLTRAETPLDRLRFLIFVLRGLSALDRHSANIAVALPGVPATTMTDLRAWVGVEAMALANAFDGRNGTDAWSVQVWAAATVPAAPAPLDFTTIGARALGRPEAPPHASDNARPTVVRSSRTPAQFAWVTARRSAYLAALVAIFAMWAGLTDVFPPQLDWVGVTVFLGLIAGWAGWLFRAAWRSARAKDVSVPTEDGHSLEAPPSPTDLLTRGDKLANRDEWHLAVDQYLTAARLAEAVGDLRDAGLGYAEAAYCADRLGEDEDAHRAYEAAVARLAAVGAEDALLARVLAAWAPIAVRLGQAGGVLAASEETLERILATGLEPVGQRQAHDRNGCLAALHDAIARTVASDPVAGRPGREVADAIGHAVTAAEGYAAAGRLEDAAHSFWLAGRLQRDSGNLADAEWSLESAVEGFDLAGRRSQRSAACNELVALLRATGQTARAAEFDDNLTDRT